MIIAQIIGNLGRDAEVKTINDKEGNHSFYYRSTTDLTTVEMASAIKNFQSWASARGVEIPDPQDEFAIRYCERQIEKTKIYGT